MYKKILKAVSAAVSKGQNTPILEDVAVWILDDGELVFGATNRFVAAMSKPDLEKTLPTFVMPSAMLKELTTGRVSVKHSFTFDKETMTATVQPSGAVYPVASGETYPAIGAFVDTNYGPIETDQFALSAVILGVLARASTALGKNMRVTFTGTEGSSRILKAVFDDQLYLALMPTYTRVTVEED